MVDRLERPPHRWPAERSGLPVILLGVAYVSVGFAHLWRLTEPIAVDFASVALYELLALSVVYGGLRLSRRGLPTIEGLRVFAASLAFGTIGFAVATALILIQVRRGTPLEFVWFASAFASVTTAAIGSSLAFYYVELRNERANLTAQHERVSELNKQLTVLHRVLRHNLRNELTVIKGHAELLLDRETDVESERSLHTLLEHAENVESLSENAYRLRQVWAEEAVIDQEVTELVETCVREAEAAHPEVEIATDVPIRAVATIHPRFQLAVTEALENAIVHNDPESVEITVSISQHDGSEPAVELVVADTGRGIPDFEPNVLELVEESPLNHATGLGLWLMFWVVEQSGGELTFEKNEPQGTVVRMTLPGAVD